MVNAWLTQHSLTVLGEAAKLVFIETIQATTMKAIRLESVHSLFTRDVENPSPGSKELLVRVEASGVCGTDRHLYHGEFPCKPPVTLGHEFSGIIEAMGAKTSGFNLGDRITCDPNISCGRCQRCHEGRVNLCQNLQTIGISRNGGMAEFAIVPEKQAFLLPLSLDPLHGAFCEPLACCIHGVDLAGIQTGGSVVVLGGGVIGLLTVQLARLAGATSVVLVTRQKAKRDLATQLGATLTLDPTMKDFEAEFKRQTSGGADAVIECAGVIETVEQAPRLARPGGKVVIVGVVSQGLKVTYEPFDLLFREVSILTSFLNPLTQSRAAEMISTSTIKVDPLISRTVAMEDAPDIIANPPAPGEVKVLIVP
jgi:L-iditol 2-dehydrogenase